MSLFGLIICGGRSIRMGADKSLLNYHGKPQRYYLYDLLKPYCERVFISCNPAQAAEIPADIELIVDQKEFEHKGPLTGLLSAHACFPEASFLVLGCDYPLLEQNDIFGLVEKFKTHQRTVVYRGRQSVEPLIGIYHEKDLKTLRNSPGQFNDSLKRFIEASNALIIGHPQPDKIKSIDTPEAYQDLIASIHRKEN